MSSTKRECTIICENQQSNTTIDLLVNTPSIAAEGLVLRGKMKIEPPLLSEQNPTSCGLHKQLKSVTCLPTS